MGVLAFLWVKTGLQAAEAALQILSGKSPADIPVAQNNQTRLTVNLRVAKTLGITVPVTTLKAAHRIIGRESYDALTPKRTTPQALSGRPDAS